METPKMAELYFGLIADSESKTPGSYSRFELHGRPNHCSISLRRMGGQRVGYCRCPAFERPAKDE